MNLKSFGIGLFFLTITLPIYSAELGSGESTTFNAEASRLLLSAHATSEIPQDIVHILLFYEKQASDPSALTLLLKEKTDQALRMANRQLSLLLKQKTDRAPNTDSSQNKLSVHTGAFTVYPSTDREGRISGWRGRTELWLESNDFSEVAKLAGQLSSLMSIGDVRFSLSPQAERNAKTKLTEEAIATFREKAQRAAKAFGYSGYTIGEVNIHDSGTISPQPMMVMATHNAGNLSGVDLPIEAGKTKVAISVSGSVKMAH